jgi:PKD domain
VPASTTTTQQPLEINDMKKVLLAALLACTALVAQSQTLTGAKMEPAEIKAGEKSTLTAAFDLKDNMTNCRVTVDFGDGTPGEAFKINQAKDVPLVATHTYAKAGTYTVKVEPRTKLPMLKCTGGDHSTTIKVLPVVVAAAAPAAGAAPTCPEGWKLDKKSVSKKTGAYTCTAKVGTAAPAGKLTCPGTLGYFENTKKGQLGCRP